MMTYDKMVERAQEGNDFPLMLKVIREARRRQDDSAARALKRLIREQILSGLPQDDYVVAMREAIGSHSISVAKWLSQSIGKRGINEPQRPLLELIGSDLRGYLRGYIFNEQIAQVAALFQKAFSDQILLYLQEPRTWLSYEVDEDSVTIHLTSDEVTYDHLRDSFELGRDLAPELRAAYQDIRSELEGSAEDRANEEYDRYDEDEEESWEVAYEEALLDLLGEASFEVNMVIFVQLLGIDEGGEPQLKIQATDIEFGGDYPPYGGPTGQSGFLFVDKEQGVERLRDHIQTIVKDMVSDLMGGRP